MDQQLLDITLKIAAALLAGSLIGLERSYHGRPAGFRTHALVCVASAVLMLVTSYQWQWFGGVPMDAIRTDPTRMAQGIMTGIGFLGAGVIFKEGATVRGLTTAASIWITASIGILYGIGFYYPAILATVVTFGVLSVFRRLEDSLPNQFYAHHRLRFAREDVPGEDEIRGLLSAHGFNVSNMSYSLTEGGAMFEYRTVIMTTKEENADKLAKTLRGMDNVLEFSISPTND